MRGSTSFYGMMSKTVFQSLHTTVQSVVLSGDHKRDSLLQTGISLLTLLLLLAPAPSAAQPTSDHLYIPPSLTVNVSTGEDDFLRGIMVGSIGTEEKIGNDISYDVFVEHHTIELLPMVFFDQGSYFPSDRFQRFISRSQVKEFVDQTPVITPSAATGTASPQLIKQRQILNIIGYRMDRSPGTTIRLQPGYSSEPGEKREVGEERAKVVRDYLVDQWVIARERIELMPPLLMADLTDNFMVQEEARRVIVLTDDQALVASISFESHDYGYHSGLPCLHSRYKALPRAGRIGHTCDRRR